MTYSTIFILNITISLIDLMYFTSL